MTKPTTPDREIAAFLLLESEILAIFHPPAIKTAYPTNILQANYSRTAFASQVAIQRISRIHDQRSQLAHALIIDLAVVGDNYHAIACPQLVIIQRHGLQWSATALSVRIVEAGLFDERIVIAHPGASGAQPGHDRQRRTLAHIIDVLFVSHAQHQHP